MSNYEANVVAATKQFFVRVSAETHTLTVKFNTHGERAGRITKRENPLEFDVLMKESSSDLDLYAKQIDELLPDYRQNLDLLTEGFVKRIGSLDPTNDAGELQDMRRAARELADTAAWVKPRVTTMRSNLETIRDSNHDHRLTRTANRVLTTCDNLFTAFEDLETFALKVSFSTNHS